MSNLITPAPGDRIVADHIAQLTSLANSALGLTVRSQTALGRIELPSVNSNPGSPANYQAWVRSDLGSGGRLHMRHSNDSGQNVPYMPYRQRQQAATKTTFTSTSTSYTDVTNATVSITTTGGRLKVFLIPEPGDLATCYATSSGGAQVIADVKCLVGATEIGTFELHFITSYQQGDGATNFSGGANAIAIGGLVWEYMPPSAGPYTVKLQAVSSIGSGTPTFVLSGCRLVVEEVGDA